MACGEIRRSLSAHDAGIRRLLRGRRVSAHLRTCEDCLAFAERIAERSTYLRLLAPPIAAPAAAAILDGVIGGGRGGGRGRSPESW
jgi:hypothetical protein